MAWSARVIEVSEIKGSKQRLLGYKTRYKTVSFHTNPTNSIVYAYMSADAGSANWPPPIISRSKTVPD
jgi:hypothetical protein